VLVEVSLGVAGTGVSVAVGSAVGVVVAVGAASTTIVPTMPEEAWNVQW
jgi:hypothetical protein